MKSVRAVCMAVVLMAGSVIVGVSPGAASNWNVSITKVNSGPASIVAGGSQKAQFTISVEYTPLPPGIVQQGLLPTVQLNDFLPDGLVIDTVPDECTKDTETSFSCVLQFGQTAETKNLVMTATAPAWLPAGTYANCASLQPPNSPSAVEAVLPGACQLDAPGVEQEVGWFAGATVDVTNDADMQLTASDPGQTDPGKSVQLTWTATNAGPSVAATPLTLTATLPAGVSFVSSGAGPWQCTVAGQQVSCTYTPTQTAPQQVCAPSVRPSFLCDPIIFPGDPIPAVTWTLSTVNPATVSSYSVQAKVSSPTPDSKSNNNATTPIINVTPVDLAIAKSAGSPVLVGDEATYSLDVSNVGTIADLGKVTVTDTLPAGAVFKSATGEGWTCAADGQKVTCTDNHPEFAVGATEKITLVAQMTSAGSPENKVEVSTTSYEKNLANNSATKVVRVRRAEQSAAALPSSPRRILSGKTEQGQKLTTRVRCVPLKASAAGQISYCKVIKGNGVVRVKVFGSTKMRVKVVQTAKGTKKYLPFVQRKTYLVKP